MKRLALFLPNWIGDAVMATPAILALHHRYPDAEIVGIGRPAIGATFAGANWLGTWLDHAPRGPQHQGDRMVLRQLRSLECDAAVLFPNSFRAALLAWLAAIPRRIGFNRYGRGWLLTDRLEAVRSPHGGFEPLPIIDDYNRLAQVLDTAKPGYRMELPLDAASRGLAAEFWQANDLHGREVIGLNPGGAFGASKHYPANHFARLARSLVDQRGCRVVVLWGPAEEATARNIVELANRPEVVTLTGKSPSIGLSKAIVSRLDLLVTTDSGPRHFAAAFDRPVVTLFGPTHIGWTETFFDKAIHLQKLVPCGPCQLRSCPLDHRCMTDLSPFIVLETACQLLDRCIEPNRNEVPYAA